MSNVTDYIEFREILKGNDDADIEVYFLGVLVHTIKNAHTRPGRDVYIEKEQCVTRAQQAVQLLWKQTGGQPQ